MNPFCENSQDMLKFGQALIALAPFLPQENIYDSKGIYLVKHSLVCLNELKGSGGGAWLNHFLRSDADQLLHSHVSNGHSLVLSGNYLEERRQNDQVVSTVFNVGNVNSINHDTYHRILIAPNKDCWTLLVSKEITSDWHFWDPNTKETISQTSYDSEWV